MESQFNDLDIDAVTGTQLMRMLGLSFVDISNPERFGRFREVIDFLKQYPEDSRQFMVSRVTRGGEVVDKLGKVFEYVNLMKRKESLNQELGNTRKAVALFTPETDPLIRNQYAERELGTLSAIQGVEKEMAIYEK